MRPCENDNFKQMWFYDRKQKVIKSRDNVFCIARNGKQLEATKCPENTDAAPSVETLISDEALNLGKETGETTLGSISMTNARNKKLYFAIDSIRIFSRVKLLKEGTENSSFDKWQLRYNGPSDFPSVVSKFQ